MAVYRKSLLYLVGRSFEDDRKTPLLGLENAFDRSTTTSEACDEHWAPDRVGDVIQWLDFWEALGIDASNRAAHVLARPSVSNGAGSIRSSHGSFDNSVEILGSALGYVRDPQQPRPVKIHRLDY